MGVAVSIKNLTKRFGALCALNNISLDIAEGEFFGLLGPNGAGKTTLISCLAGLSRPDAGQMTVLGHSVIRDYRQARQCLGIVPQELVFDPFFTVRETLRIQSGYFGIRRNDDWIEEILQHLELTDKADTNMRRLSGGMKRRVLVAQALVHKPPVIVLDEPTAGVDVALRHNLWQFIRRLNQEGHTIILTTHYLEEAETLCKRIAMLQHGQIIALDSTDHLLQAFSGHKLELRLAEGTQLPAALTQKTAPTASEGNWWHLHLADFFAVEHVLSSLREANITIQDMRLAPPDLEEVFVHLMQQGTNT